MGIRGMITILLLCLIGCGESRRSVKESDDSSRSARPRPEVTLTKSLGIKTAGGVFTPLIDAGQRLPYTCSQTFSNKTDGGPVVQVEISQKDASGVEVIASPLIAIPAAANGTLNIVVTLKISEEKQLLIKTTVTESASVQEFGPYRVE